MGVACYKTCCNTFKIYSYIHSVNYQTICNGLPFTLKDESSSMIDRKDEGHMFG